MSQRQALLADVYEWLARELPSLRVSVGLSGHGMMPASALSDPRSAALAELIGLQKRLLPGADPRTEAAAALGQYCYFLGLAVIAPYLHSGLIIDAAPGNLVFRLEPPDMPGPWRRYHMCWLSPEPAPAVVDGPDAGQPAPYLLRSMLEEHIGPLIAALKERSRFGRDAQWRIAGDSIAAAFLEIGKRLGEPQRAAGEALAVLKQEGSPFCNRQLEFITLAVPGAQPDAPIEETFRLRGGCCRLYRLEGGTLCPTCVLADRHWQRDELERFMREKSRAGQHVG